MLKHMYSKSVCAERLLRAVACFCAVVLLLFVFLELRAEAGVYESVLRFHVVANSDSETDQNIKLSARDFLLEAADEGLRACESRAEAAVYLSAAKERLLVSLRAFLRDAGVSYGAEATLETEQHTKKVYGDVTLPAGEYLTFRVVLGEGRGRNFFCVLFPPICKNSVTESAGEVLYDYGVPSESVRKIRTQEDLEVRFFFWESIKRFFQL